MNHTQSRIVVVMFVQWTRSVCGLLFMLNQCTVIMCLRSVCCAHAQCACKCLCPGALLTKGEQGEMWISDPGVAHSCVCEAFKEDEIALIGESMQNVHANVFRKDTCALPIKGEQGDLRCVVQGYSMPKRRVKTACRFGMPRAARLRDWSNVLPFGGQT